MKHMLRFGPFALDPTTRLLEKDGRRIRLAGQPMRILLRLVAHPGVLVTRDAFRRELWGQDTFVDFEQGLNTGINRLRQALGDSADSPRYIETIPGQGYCFIAPVRESQPASTTAGDTVQSQRGDGSRRWFVMLSVAAGMGLLAIRSWIGLTGQNSTSEAVRPIVQFSVEPPDDFYLEPSAARQAFDVSPDGRSLVFTARGTDGRYHAWRRDLSDPALHPIDMATGAHTVFWAPDSRQFLFAVGASLRLADTDTGPFQVISGGQGRVVHGALMNQDRLILMRNRRRSFEVAIGETQARDLPLSYGWPETLPDGERILYIDWSHGQVDHVARLVRPGLDSGEGTEILRTNSRVQYARSRNNPETGYLLFVRAGSLLAQAFDPRTEALGNAVVPLVSGISYFAPSGAADFAVSDTGALVYQPYTGRAQLTWVDREGKPAGTLGPADQRISWVRRSPDGSRVLAEFFDSEAGYPRLWIFDAESGNGRPLMDEMSGGALWSPDATEIAYAGFVADGMPQITLRESTGIGEGRLLLPALPPDQLQVPTDWYQDMILYQNGLSGDVWAARTGSEAPGPLLTSSASEAGAAISPDGHWIAFISNESGRPEAYVQRFEANPTPRVYGERYQISRNGALNLCWRGDSREIFYAGPDEAIYAVGMDTDLGPLAAPVALFDIELDATAAMTTPFTFDVSDDGQRFLLPRLTRAEPDRLIVIMNWEELLSE